MSAAISPQQRHTRANRCPICDGADGDARGQGKRCSGFTSADGEYVHCSRQELAGAIDANGAGLFAHRMVGVCRCGRSHGCDVASSRSNDRDVTYDYRDEHDILLMQVVRKPGKKFLQRIPDGADGWTWKVGSTRRVPYRLPELIAADVNKPVYVTEGERDAETLIARGLVATTNPGGAGKWSAVADTARTVLRDRVVVVVADRDEPGERHALDVAASLEGVARSVCIVVPRAPHKDVTDVIDAGGSVDDLVPLVPGAMSAPKPMNDVAVELPEIWPGIDISQTVTESIAALAHDPELFVRGGALTRVIESDGTDGERISRETGAPVMRRVVPPYLTERLSLHARFMKSKMTGRGDARTESAVQVSPPVSIATHVLARETWPGFRSLMGVVTSPTMRRDGSVLQTPGYDAASGLLYVPRCEYPKVQASPTRADGLGARDRLLEIVDDFPMGDTARAAWLASLFTLCARDLVDGSTPLVAVDAPTPGSGKGLAVRAQHIVAFGVEVAHMSLPPTDEEFRKQITTTLLSGDPAVLLDNVGVQLGGDSIEALITAPVWKARLLGKNEDSGAIVPRLVVFAAGNGLEFIGDMGRRTLRIRIDTRHESPEERTDFRHPDRAGADKLLAWVRANRAALVVDVLTCLRAWHVAGRPGEVKPWGSFESWSSTIGKCVQWLGLPDPTLARATQDAALDPVRQALSVIYDAIRRFSQQGRGVTAGELVRAAFPAAMHGPQEEEDLAEAIGALTPNARDASTRARVLGRKLKVGRIIDGQRLAAHTGGARSVRYSLVPVE